VTGDPWEKRRGRPIATARAKATDVVVGTQDKYAR